MVCFSSRIECPYLGRKKRDLMLFEVFWPKIHIYIRVSRKNESKKFRIIFTCDIYQGKASYSQFSRKSLDRIFGKKYFLIKIVKKHIFLQIMTSKTHKIGFFLPQMLFSINWDICCFPNTTCLVLWGILTFDSSGPLTIVRIGLKAALRMPKCVHIPKIYMESVTHF